MDGACFLSDCSRILEQSLNSSVYLSFGAPMTAVTPQILVEQSQKIGQQSASQTLKAIAKAYPGKLFFTLSLVALENALLLAYPLFAGFAVDSIMRGDASSALFYALVVLAFWVVGAALRAVDTRTFTRIYADLAVPVILNQRLQNQSTSTSAARVLLAIEPWIGLACLAALLLCMTLLPRFARRNQELHERLNDRLEKEIGLVEKVGPDTLQRHYRVLSRLRIGLSDREAAAFLFIGSVAAVLFVIAISQLALSPAVKAGHVYAVMTYLWTFVSSLDEAPSMVDQLARLRDIGKRVDPGLGDTSED